MSRSDLKPGEDEDYRELTPVPATIDLKRGNSLSTAGNHCLIWRFRNPFCFW